MLTGVTEGGISCAFKRSGSAVAYCSLSIKAGTRYEGRFHFGTAHFVEHCLFKGTRRRSSAVINGALESLGGELNAYTTKEEIVLHATVLKKDLAKALDLLLDLAFEPAFPPAEIEKEKTVVLDEIASCKDIPSEAVYDKFEEKLFAATPLERPILGTAASVRKISAAQMSAYVAETFLPERMCLSVVSPYEEAYMRSMVKRVERRYHPLEKARSEGAPASASTPAASVSVSTPVASALAVTPAAPVFNETVDKHNYQVNCVLGGMAPSLAEEDDRIAAILLCNLLGGPAMNSILGSRLREKNGWVYNIECSYTPYCDSGIAAIIFGCDKSNLDKCLKAIHKELALLREKPLSESRLKAAKRQILGQNSIGMESGEAQCLSMGKSMLSFGRIASDEEVEAKVLAVTAGRLQALANRIFDPGRLSSLIYY